MKMKRLVGPLLCLTLLSAVAVAHADGWQKYVSEDGSFSLHHPAGWQVTEEASVIAIEAGDGRQISIIALPYDSQKSAQEHAHQMISLLAAGNPGLSASNWRTEDDGSAAYAEVSFTDGGIPQAGDIVVVKDADAGQALWFSYSAPAAGYDRPAALEVLQVVMGSLAPGRGSEPPTGAALSPEAQEIVNSFIFVLEFSLGQPLSVESERLVARELTRDWGGADDPAQDLAMYVPLAQQVMSLDQEPLAELQRDLHGVLIEWLNESDPNDPVVGMVRERIAAGEQIVAAGQPALTAVAAQAYAEITALSELLHREPQAGIGDIEADVVAEIRGQLTDAWGGFSDEDRRDVLTMPGVWGVLRHALLLGPQEQQEQARTIIARLTTVAAAETPPAPQTGAATAGGGAGDDIRDQMTRSFLVGETLRMAQQHTFNTWRWSMGYCRGPMGF